MNGCPRVPAPPGRVDLSGVGGKFNHLFINPSAGNRKREQSLPQGADNLCGCFQLPKFAHKIVLLETFESLGCTADL